MRGKSVASGVGSNVRESGNVLVAGMDPSTPIGGELRACGLRIMEARTAGEALAIAGQHPIALLASSERLADMSGPELAREIFDRHAVYSVLIVEADRAGGLPWPDGVVACLRRMRVVEEVIPTIRAVFSLARELKSARIREQELRAALAAERDINTAVGVLMERLQVPRENAFERLRGHARSQRKRIVDLSRGLLGSAADSQRITAELAGADATPRDSTADVDD